MSSQPLKSGCFCGEVQFEVTGEPVAMGYCHCSSCRQWSAGPVNAFTLWKPESLRVTRGAGSIGTDNKTPISYRKWCTSVRWAIPSRTTRRWASSTSMPPSCRS